MPFEPSSTCPLSGDENPEPLHISLWRTGHRRGCSGFASPTCFVCCVLCEALCVQDFRGCVQDLGGFPDPPLLPRTPLFWVWPLSPHPDRPPPEPLPDLENPPPVGPKWSTGQAQTGQFGPMRYWSETVLAKSGAGQNKHEAGPNRSLPPWTPRPGPPKILHPGTPELPCSNSTKKK